MDSIYEDLYFLYNTRIKKEDLYYYDKPIKEEFLNDNNILQNEDENIIKTYKFESNVEIKKSRVILLIVQTGNGKTTLINFLVNAFLGVRFKDNYRFKMIIEKKKNEAFSNTEGVNEYNINVRGYPSIKIIDCQGLGDTTGLVEDKKLLPKLKKLFESIRRINCIFFVINESQFRLDSLSQYIYKFILDLFAKDMKKILL